MLGVQLASPWGMAFLPDGSMLPKQDELLELYTAWRDKPDTATEENLERVVGEILGREHTAERHLDLEGLAQAGEQARGEE